MQLLEKEGKNEIKEEIKIERLTWLFENQKLNTIKYQGYKKMQKLNSIQIKPKKVIKT
jgi:hypothetical protein